MPTYDHSMAIIKNNRGNICLHAEANFANARREPTYNDPPPSSSPFLKEKNRCLREDLTEGVWNFLEDEKLSQQALFPSVY